MDLPSIVKENATKLRELTDEVNVIMNALSALGCEIDKCDDFTVNIVLRKLDESTARSWEMSSVDNSNVTLELLIKYLQARCSALEATSYSDTTAGDQKHIQKRIHLNSQKPEAANECKMCKGSHPLYNCAEFRALSKAEMMAFIDKNRLCRNCLGSGHFAGRCKSRSCYRCGQRHHTLIHPKITATMGHLCNRNDREDLLQTAVIYCEDRDGKRRPYRMLLDTGAQGNVISAKAADELGLQRKDSLCRMQGISPILITSTQSMRVRFFSNDGSYVDRLEFAIMQTDHPKTPSNSLDWKSLKIPKDSALADNKFNKSAPVDGILGSRVVWDVLRKDEDIILSSGIRLISTNFGWVVSAGRTATSDKPKDNKSQLGMDELQRIVERFWLQEEIANQPQHNSDTECVEHFVRTHNRDDKGRFLVELPIKPERSPKDLGESYTMAQQRLWALERKFRRDENLKKQYCVFLEEYLSLGHMKRIYSSSDKNKNNAYYIPHHAVFKMNSPTTKSLLRVVFDASAKTKTGTSLNDILQVGPTVQPELFDILLRFREYKFVFICDITKMYRQVNVKPDQTCLQRILWRNDCTKPIEVYELTTLTYGTASAAYLATRVLNQLAETGRDLFPLASSALLHQFYVDDGLVGNDSVSDTIRLRMELIDLLGTADLQLAKWASNEPSLLEGLDKEKDKILDISKGEISTLGMQWDTVNDEFA